MSEDRSAVSTARGAPSGKRDAARVLALLDERLPRFRVPVRDVRGARPKLCGGTYGRRPFRSAPVAVNTALLLLSSITYGFAMLEMARDRRERGRDPRLAGDHRVFRRGLRRHRVPEFAHLIHEGAGPWRSAFLSSFFTLVGTHGTHVTFGLIWLDTLMVQVSRKGLVPANRRRLLLSWEFWHFLDLVWIGVFTFVYLMGVLP